MRIANPSIRYFVRLLVGVLFIVSAFGKLMDVENFGNLIVSYGFFWSALLAPVIVIAEMGVGIALVLDMYPRVVSWVGIGMLIVFTGAFFYGNTFNGVKDCGCFGNLNLVSLPVWATYLRNAILLFLLIIGMEKGRAAAPASLALGIWTACLALTVFFSGYTFSLPQSFKERMPRRHPLIGMDVSQTPLPQFVDMSPDSTYTLYVFSYTCVSCINGIPALLEYQDSSVCDRVIGLAVNEDKNAEIGSYYHLPFQRVQVDDALSGLTQTVPTLLYIRKGKIEFVVEGGVPSSWWFRKAYLENL